MSLTVRTNLGNIVVNDNVIAKTIIKGAEKSGEKLFLSNSKGKLLGAVSRINAGDLAGNYVIKEIDAAYYLDFYAVIRFGASISAVSKIVLDSIEEEMHEMFPEKAGHITLHIVGVKSKQIALRNIEVKRDYEASR